MKINGGHFSSFQMCVMVVPMFRLKMTLASIDTSAEVAKEDVVASSFRNVFRLHSDSKTSPSVMQKSGLMETFESQGFRCGNWGHGPPNPKDKIIHQSEHSQSSCQQFSIPPQWNLLQALQQRG
jgi:hypothetical protein